MPGTDKKAARTNSEGRSSSSTQKMHRLLGEDPAAVQDPVNKEETSSVLPPAETKTTATASGIDPVHHEELWSGVGEAPKAEEQAVAVSITDGRKKPSKLSRMLGGDVPRAETKEESKTEASLPEAGRYSTTLWYYPGGIRAAGVGGSFGHVAIELSEQMTEGGVNFTKSQVYSSKYLTYGRGQGPVGVAFGEDSDPNAPPIIQIQQPDEEKVYNSRDNPAYKGVPLQLPPGNYYKIIEATEQFLARRREDYNIISNSCVHAVIEFMQTMYGDQEALLIQKLAAINKDRSTPAEVFLVVAQYNIQQARKEILDSVQTEPDKRKVVIALIQNDIARLEIAQKGKGSSRAQKIAVLNRLLADLENGQKSTEELLYSLDNAIQSSNDKTQKQLIACQPLLLGHLQASLQTQESKKSAEDLAREELVAGYYQSYFRQDEQSTGLFFKEPPEKNKHHTLILEANIAMLKFVYGGQTPAELQGLKEVIDNALKATKPTFRSSASKLHGNLLGFQKMLEQGYFNPSKTEAKQAEAEATEPPPSPTPEPTTGRRKTMDLPEGWTNQSSFSPPTGSERGTNINPEPGSNEAAIVIHGPKD